MPFKILSLSIQTHWAERAGDQLQSCGHSTGPQTLLFANISVLVTQIKKIRKQCLGTSWMCLGKNRSFSLVEGRNEFWALSIKPVYTYASAFLNEISPSLVANPTRVRIQLWLEIPPGSGWIFTHGRIFTRGKELEVTLVVFSTVWLVFLPDTLVCPDVAVSAMFWELSCPLRKNYSCLEHWRLWWEIPLCAMYTCYI